LLTATVCLVLLFTAVLRLLLGYLRLSCPAPLAILFAAAVGSALHLLLLAFVPDSADALGTTILLYGIFLLCGATAHGAERDFSLKRLLQGVCAGIFIGAVREVLSRGTLLGLPMPVTATWDTFGQTTAGQIGIGGLLAAAAGLWLFRLSHPVASPCHIRGKQAWQLGVLTAAVGAVNWLLLSHVSLVWRFWIGILLTVIPLLMSKQELPAWGAVLTPAVILMVSGEGSTPALWMLIGAGAAVGVLVPVVVALLWRLRRSPLPRSFGGAPAVLTVAAVVLSALSAL
jgi:hypothetical protein